MIKNLLQPTQQTDYGRNEPLSEDFVEMYESRSHSPDPNHGRPHVIHTGSRPSRNDYLSSSRSVKEAGRLSTIMAPDPVDTSTTHSATFHIFGQVDQDFRQFLDGLYHDQELQRTEIFRKALQTHGDAFARAELRRDNSIKQVKSGSLEADLAFEQRFKRSKDQFTSRLRYRKTEQRSTEKQREQTFQESMQFFDSISRWVPSSFISKVS